MRIGSVCSGYGGLDAAVREVLGGELAWVADNDPDKAAILDHHFPGVPNLGDLETVEWSGVEPVDVLAGGFPCKDISCAGRRAGLRKGNHSGVWYHMARAIAELRPPLVVIENVKELLSERADSDMEPCPWCMGDAGPESAMRALGAVLADLAEIGFDAEWVSVPAASAGACHLRWRVFILAWPADAERDRLAGGRAAARQDAGWPSAASVGCGSPDSGDLPAADPAGVGEREPADEADALAGGREARAVPGGGGARIAVSGAQRRPEWETAAAWRHAGAFGRYEAAVRQHERIFGRLVPAPVERGRNGNPRLSPRFSEWMMGLPDGWVADVPGLSHKAQLTAIGDGVVPAQAAMALRLLLDRAGIPALVAAEEVA